MDDKAAASLNAIAWEYLNAGRRIPDHLIGDLQDVARTDSIAHVLRRDAQRLLERV